MPESVKKIASFFFILVFIFTSLSCESRTQENLAEKKDYVILLHGLARTNRSMVKLKKMLSKHGYKVINVNYPSTKHPIEFLAEEFLGKVIKQCSQMPRLKIHFVTHSLGGIIVRYYLKHHQLSNLGRAVMLSPPNQGSEAVDYMKDTFMFKKINGPAGQQLGTDKDSIPLKLGAVDFELGVITGSKTFDPLFSMIIPGPDDGKVSVQRAKVAGMADFLVMPYSHTVIMQKEEVIEQVIHFLEQGSFRHPVHEDDEKKLK